jgi:hypothetical protein
MNYRKIYNDLIEKRIRIPLNEGYKELHHIIPKALGGKDNKDNLVYLTAREHFICHVLLVKMFRFGSKERAKMLHALNSMQRFSHTQHRYFNSRLYESLRKEFSVMISKKMKITQKGSKNSQYGSFWITNGKDNLKVKSLDSFDVSWTKGRTFPPKIRHKIHLCESCTPDKNNAPIFKEIKECYRCRAVKYYNLFTNLKYVSANMFVKDGHYPHSVVSLTKLWNKHKVGYDPKFGRGKTKDR